ncbi:hypothetical protein BJX70DRAFT_399144 [Aspergillus crustosus]
MLYYTEVLTYCLCEFRFQMPFFQSCKSVACGLVCCCDRHPDSAYSKTQYHYHHAEPSKRPFNRLRSWPKPAQKNNTQPEVQRRPSPQQRREEDTHPADELYETEKQNPPSSEKTTHQIFTYDTILFTFDSGNPVYRRLLLDFRVSFDAVSDQIPPLVNLEISPYDGPSVRLPNGIDVTPIGTLCVKWQLFKGKRRSYETTFLVIKDLLFDMMLGRASIEKYKLWEEDNEIQKRLSFRD